MIDQKPGHEYPVVQGAAEHLPVRSGSFDAAMALLAQPATGPISTQVSKS